ncbi:MAG TPA: LpxD N-terminal domain-containing protein, partial [Steroidobacteraceae bacterium]|nr:LpxD N-terminal domain-containing protein [Steroidobacteraceae bacterium]
MTSTLGELAVRFGCELRGDPSIVVDSVASLSQAGPRSVAFLANPKYLVQLESTRAGVVILDARSAGKSPVAALIAANPHATFARIAALLHPEPPLNPGVHPAALVAPDARVDASAEITAHAVVGAGARIGARC